MAHSSMQVQHRAAALTLVPIQHAAQLVTPRRPSNAEPFKQCLVGRYTRELCWQSSDCKQMAQPDRWLLLYAPSPI